MKWRGSGPRKPVPKSQLKKAAYPIIANPIIANPMFPNHAEKDHIMNSSKRLTPHLKDLQELIADEDTATKPYVHKPLVAQALCSQALHGRPVWRYPYNYQLLWPTDH